MPVNGLSTLRMAKERLFQLKSDISIDSQEKEKAGKKKTHNRLSMDYGTVECLTKM